MNGVEESRSEEARPHDKDDFVRGSENSSYSSASARSDNDDDTSCGSDSTDKSGDEFYDEFDIDDSMELFKEENLRDIEDDSPHLLSLSIGWHQNTAYDCERLGNAIGDSARLEKLRVYRLSTPLCAGIVRNRHLRRLEILKIGRYDQEFFTALTPLFQYNHRLRCLVIEECSCLHNGYMEHSVEITRLVNNNVQALASALSKCDKYSLREVNLSGNELHDDNVAKLIGAMERYVNLSTLKLESNKIRMKGCIALTRLLENPKSKLREIFIGGNQINDDCMVVLAKAFKNNKTVKTIALGKTGLSRILHRTTNPITAGGWRAFAEVFSNHTNSLEKIHLNGTNIDSESANMLATSVVGSSTLRLLDLCCCKSIEPAGWQYISNFLQNLSSGLSVLDLSCNNLDDATATKMANALFKHKTLVRLNMGNNKSITSDGWQAFFRVYPCSESSLESLRVRNNLIDDTGFATLVHKLASTSLIKTLDILGNDLISTDGLRGLFNLLRHPRCKLTALFLNNSVDEDLLVQYAHALARNDSLRRLIIGIDRDLDPTRVRNAYSNLLCNKSTIDATYSSNHTLEDLLGLPVFYEREGRNEVGYFLEMHKFLRRHGYGKSEIARIKVLAKHFSTGHNNIHVFSDMKPKILPQALHWIGANNHGRSLLYQVLHCVPSLFEFKLDTRPKLS